MKAFIDVLGETELMCITWGGSEVECWQKNGGMYMMETTHMSRVKDKEALAFEILSTCFHLFVFDRIFYYG